MVDSRVLRWASIFTTQSLHLCSVPVSITGQLADFKRQTNYWKIGFEKCCCGYGWELPGFSKPGQWIDVSVSAIGKATNLKGNF